MISEVPAPSTIQTAPSTIHPAVVGGAITRTSVVTANPAATVADPTRLHILWILTRGEADVAALIEQTGSSKTSVSQHLAKLRFSGLVTTRKEGRRVIYRIVDGHLTRLILEGINHADHMVTGEPPHE